MDAEVAATFVEQFCTAMGMQVFDISDTLESGLDRALTVSLVSELRKIHMSLEGLRLILGRIEEKIR